ncbi:MAG: hypothetical protein JWM37_17 [Candidatus Saccharibacteria bacterium]|nr:hypothetical protein [Candidatus Saccharibacteria bacterium]
METLVEVEKHIGSTRFANAVIGIVFMPVGILLTALSYELGNDVTNGWRAAVVMFIGLGMFAALSTLHYIKRTGGHSRTKFWTRLSLLAYLIFGISLLFIPA